MERVGINWKKTTAHVSNEGAKQEGEYTWQIKLNCERGREGSCGGLMLQTDKQEECVLYQNSGNTIINSKSAYRYCGATYYVGQTSKFITLKTACI